MRHEADNPSRRVTDPGDTVVRGVGVVTVGVANRDHAAGLQGGHNVRITGDKDLADYARPPIAEMPVRTKFKYWSGSMELPLKVQRAGAPSPMRRWSLEQ